MRPLFAASLVLASLLVGACGAQFQLPTANRALYAPDGSEGYFVGTVGKPWTSGTFGCVRTEGQQLHEGIDIHCLQRDRHGEPTDPVMATADGVVAYINSKTGLSTYGRYIILMHKVEGIEVYSIYAHLSAIRAGLKQGMAVKAGESIGVMGRSANTREGISKERAHLHFELSLFLNENFAAWYKKASPGQRNDHGLWNGQNLVGLDPREILLSQRSKDFSFLNYVRQQTALCRVFVKDTHFPYLRRYPALVQRNPIAEREGIAGYEIALNYSGVPFELIPRASSEVKSRSGKYTVLSVNALEQQMHPCRHLVTKNGSKWSLTTGGQHLLDLLTY